MRPSLSQLLNHSTNCSVLPCKFQYWNGQWELQGACLVKVYILHRVPITPQENRPRSLVPEFALGILTRPLQTTEMTIVHREPSHLSHHLALWVFGVLGIARCVSDLKTKCSGLPKQLLCLLSTSQNLTEVPHKQTFPHTTHIFEDGEVTLARDTTLSKRHCWWAHSEHTQGYGYMPWLFVAQLLF